MVGSSSRDKSVAKLETQNLLLEHNLRPNAVNQVWHSDSFFIPTDEGGLYLAGAMDGVSKRLVGYAMADLMRTELVLGTARWREAKAYPSWRQRFHSYQYQRELKSQGMLARFTNTGACLANAITESFWATLKKEPIYPSHFRTSDEARLANFEDIEVYHNRERLHSSLLY